MQSKLSSAGDGALTGTSGTRSKRIRRAEYSRPSRGWTAACACGWCARGEAWFPRQAACSRPRAAGALPTVRPKVP